MCREWRATYRLQLHAGFPLPAAAAILPYLAQLGITHVYLSPCLQASPGSMHGYDATNPTRISDDLGGEEGWKEFCHTARALGLGVLLDIVPNHMAASPHNPWWDDLLTHGPASRYAAYFDIFPGTGDRSWKVHISTLGSPYREALEQGQLQISTEAAAPRIKCGEQSWPLNPGSWAQLLGPSAARDAMQALAGLASRHEWDDESRGVYARDFESAQAIWAGQGPASGEHIQDLNRDPVRLHALMEDQHYALHHWRREGEVANYRRFFDVGSLVGMRVDDPAVFAASHARIAAMVRAGEVDGLRVDHPDGLADPQAYLQQLRELMPDGRVYVEKILENEERLRTHWPVAGTVGYDFLSKVNRLWMDEQKSDILSSIYADFTGHTVNLPKVVREKKTHILNEHFSADLDRLADYAAELARTSWQTFDLSPLHLRRALALLTVELTVYRTYLGEGRVDAEDRALLERTFAAAASQGGDIDPAAFAFLKGVFLTEALGPAGRELVRRWQQLTPAVMAKGVEDTTFYCYDRLVACNEVGAQASLLGISSDKFHEFCHHLAAQWPKTLLATSTHDTKRSEDVRARLGVLTEIPEAWGVTVRQWSAMNLPAWQGREPDRHLEYLLYQTLVGAWPLSQERAWGYLLKASREAKINTSWHGPNPAYEFAIGRFLKGIYESADFQTSLAAFVQPLIVPGRINGLAQTLIKLTAPGVPDFYQGTEFWDLSLVDPDNRRPVDFLQRAAALDALGDVTPARVWPEENGEGRAKLWLTARGLALRKAYAGCFSCGSAYQPVVAQGSRMGHILGYRRGHEVLVLVPRFHHTLAGNWADTRIPLPEGEWKNWFTGASLQGSVSPVEVFRDFPVAALVLSP